MSVDRQAVPKRATMRDVAHAAGVPVSAVALTMAAKPGVSAARRSAIFRAAGEVGYGRAAPTDRYLCGLIIEELSEHARWDGYIDTLIRGIYSAARVAGVQIVLSFYHPASDPIEELRELAARPLDGLIVANGGDITLPVIDQLAGSGLPLVLLENRVDRPISSVSCDNFSAGLQTTRHLIGLGHRRIGLVEGSDRYVSLRDRARGYAVALAEAGIPLDPNLVATQAARVQRKGYEQAEQLLSLREPPTAIYAVSDKSALGAAAALADHGLRAGRDISLAGTDNVEASASNSPALTTFDTSAKDLGAVAIRDLAAMTAHPGIVTHTAVHGHLVVRETTGPLPGSGAGDETKQDHDRATA